MFFRAGFASPGVGGGHGDGVRPGLTEIQSRRLDAGAMQYGNYYIGNLTEDVTTGTVGPGFTTGGGPYRLARYVINGPFANQTQPRAWGALACCYLGTPR